MDGVGQWKLIEPELAQGADKPGAEVAPQPARPPYALMAAAVALIVAAVGVAVWATLPAGGAAVQAQDGAVGNVFSPLRDANFNGVPGVLEASPIAATVELNVVVDVQGAVQRPGVHSLPLGSRVGDAVAAAGGYAPAVDIAAASRQLNLAAKLADGDQIRVPALGETVNDATSTSEPASSEGGLVDLNSATEEELDTLPGIGPVTAEKIISAREEAPFASVDELLARGVVGAGTFEELRELVTVSR